jgi:hypothetical protein
LLSDYQVEHAQCLKKIGVILSDLLLISQRVARGEAPPAVVVPRPGFGGRGKWIAISLLLLVLFAGALVRYR